MGINITNIIQAGGHQLLKVRDTPVIKPTKLSEVEFYRDYIPKYPELLDLVPKFYGYGLTKDIKDMYSEAEYNLILEKGYTHYIELENLIGQNKFVDIVDIKLGVIHCKSTASLIEIREHLFRNRFSIMSKYKFRLDGAIMNYTKYQKEECRNMNIDQVESILKQIDEKHVKKIILWIDHLISVLAGIDINIYGPSLLIILDREKDEINIKLIDFTVYEECKNGVIYDDLLLSLKYVRNIFTLM